MQNEVIIPNNVGILTSNGFKRIQKILPNDELIGIENGKLSTFQLKKISSNWIHGKSYNIYSDYSYSSLSEGNLLFTDKKKVRITEILSDYANTKVELLYKGNKIDNYLYTENDFNDQDIILLGFLKKSCIHYDNNVVTCRLFNIINAGKIQELITSVVNGDVEINKQNTNYWLRFSLPTKIAKIVDNTKNINIEIEKQISKMNVKDLIKFYFGYLIGSSFGQYNSHYTNSSIIFNDEIFDFTIMSIAFICSEIPFKINYIPKNNYENFYLEMGIEIENQIPNNYKYFAEYIANHEFKKEKFYPYIKHIEECQSNCRSIIIESITNPSLFFGNLLVI